MAKIRPLPWANWHRTISVFAVLRRRIADMSATLLDGKTLSERIISQCAERAAAVAERGGRRPCLAAILVGADEASATYVRMKAKRCERAGVGSRPIYLDETTTTEQLIDQIQSLNRDPDVHGILLQHPVPEGVDERAAFEAIDPAKDVDGVTTRSFGATGLGVPGFGACTPGGILKLLDHYGVELSGRNAVVVGRSAILGKPMALMLLARNATVTVCHSRTRDVAAEVGRADLVVAAVGRAGFVRGDWIRQNAVVVDAGYNEGNVGDVDQSGAAERARMLTPVPGGVGPMTIATLIEQTIDAAATQLGVSA